MEQGVIIGADQAAEWLIPWWWERYSSYCSRPVTIVDFGMSKSKVTWCEKRMDVIPCTADVAQVLPKNKIAKEHLKLWKKQYRGPLWTARNAWFKKPRACLLSPYELSLWIVLDCEVCGSLDSLFARWNPKFELAIGRQDFRLDEPIVYNSGVILFRKNAPFLARWDQLCRAQNGTMMGDQDVLTSILLEGTTHFEELSPYYNWLMYAGIEPGIVIAHWAAGWGKELISKFGGLHALNKKTLAR